MDLAKQENELVKAENTDLKRQNLNLQNDQSQYISKRKSLSEDKALTVISLNIGGTHEMMTSQKVFSEGAAIGSRLEEFFCMNPHIL